MVHSACLTTPLGSCLIVPASRELDGSDGPGTVPDKVAQILRAEIASGRLASGGRLPTEHELCARFGVSRPAIREAIAQLKYDGLVASRQGSGATITGTPRAFRIDSEQIESRREIAKIFELRVTFETGSAALAARQRDAQGLSRIAQALDEMARAIEGEGDAVQSDTDFHLAIAQATGNRYFAEFMVFLEGRLRHSIEVSRRELLGDRLRAQLVHGEHESILRAVEGGDAERARAAMLLHLSNAAEELGLRRGAGIDVL